MRPPLDPPLLSHELKKPPLIVFIFVQPLVSRAIKRGYQIHSLMNPVPSLEEKEYWDLINGFNSATF